MDLSLTLPTHPWWWLTALLVLGLGGCVNREMAVSLPTERPPPFSASGQVKVAEHWWTSFGDPGLNQQVDDYPGLTWTFEGSNAEMREATASLWGSFGLALAVIYALLAIAFKGYLQPLIVLIAIPFGIVGAVLGHIMLGYDLSLVSIMGVVALSGVVINDSLIMIDYANRHRGSLSAFDVILQAGVRRFRPIMLTTLTTFGGLMPLIFEKSLQAQYIIPMAISLGFGILFSTAIILVLIPCLYLILEDLRDRVVPQGPQPSGPSADA